jgi:DNA-binding transcriptional MerR regulator
MTETAALWTLDELAERVGAALSVGYDGQLSGRVRNVPDQRAIRYYTTLGLMDRAAARRGSVALYGRRHLLQLVAIKKLQARGLPLARIQAELAGATDEQLERVARLPRLEAPAGSGASVASASAAYSARSRAGGFWKRGPDVDVPMAASTSGLIDVEPGRLAPGSAPAETGGRPGVATLQGVRLADGVTLLLDRVRSLRDDEVRAIQVAAERLLEALRARGLTGDPRGREPQ